MQQDQRLGVLFARIAPEDDGIAADDAVALQPRDPLVHRGPCHIELFCQVGGGLARIHLQERQQPPIQIVLEPLGHCVPPAPSTDIRQRRQIRQFAGIRFSIEAAHSDTPRTKTDFSAT